MDGMGTDELDFLRFTYHKARHTNQQTKFQAMIFGMQCFDSPRISWYVMIHVAQVA